MLKTNKIFTVAIVAFFMLILIPGTAKAISYDALYDSGTSASYDFEFTLYQNDSINMNSDENITFDILCQPYDTTSVNATYNFEIWLNDGTSNNSYTVAIDAKNDTVVWASIEVDPTVFVKNYSGVLDYALYDAGMTQLDYHTRTMGFYESPFDEILSVGILAMVIITFAIAIGVILKTVPNMLGKK